MSSRTPRAEIVESLRAAGHTVEYLQADMREPSAPNRLVADVIGLMGRLDILVNNAGIAQHGATDEMTETDYRALMDVNLDSVFRSCQAALKPMLAQKSGIILNIGSISGFISNIPQAQAAYNASKAAVHMLTKSIASEYAASGIRANAIAPGYIETDMTSGGLSDPTMAPVWRSMTPLPMIGTATDIGAAAVYLCSEASRYVTGEVLVIDGGYTTR